MRRILGALLSLILISSFSHAQDGWTIRATDRSEYYGPTLANGMTGLVASDNELQVKEVVLNGAFDVYGRGDGVSNMILGINQSNFEVEFDGADYLSELETSNWAQELDMKNAWLTTWFTCKGVDFEHRIVSLRHLPFTSLNTITLSAKRDVHLKISTLMTLPGMLHPYKQELKTLKYQPETFPLMRTAAKSPTGKFTLEAYNTWLFDGERRDIKHVLNDSTSQSGFFEIDMKKGESFTFHLISAQATSKHFDDPQMHVERMIVYAAEEGIDRLLSRHKEAWNNLWQGDLIIEGDPLAQQDIRFALYNLYSFVREGSGQSMSPMGLSGNGYNGHVFWDTELWMYPPLLIFHPEIARSLLDYRVERLDEAKQNAFLHGYRGAMFPWESDDTGTEATPTWASSGTLEHHITGCVNMACWNYYRVTKDIDWLRDKGWLVLKETADFWISRVEKNSKGEYCINNVVGADEYAEGIDNNAFTNGIAITSLHNAVEAASVLGYRADPQWSVVAKAIPIRQMPEGQTAEFDGYDGRIIKQADVNLLAYPLSIITDREQIETDLYYYEQKIDPNGPAMGFSILSILHSSFGNEEKAFELFERSYLPNKKPPFGVLSESKNSANPYFATGAGGLLQIVINGFGGLRITDIGVEQKAVPLLPAKWDQLIIKGVGVDNCSFVIKH